MAFGPRFRLRTVFLLFVCAAVGLAIYPDPIGALEPAIAAAMVIGLVQQIRQLRRWQPVADESARFSFARRYAIGWRMLLALTIAVCLAAELAIGNGLLTLPRSDDLTLHGSLPDVVLPICVVVVLCNSVSRWQTEPSDRTFHPRRGILLSTLALAIGLIVIIDDSLTPYLVHKATVGIEAAIPPKLQRPGVYPNLQEEGYRPFWISIGAVTCLVGAGAAFAWSVRGARSAPAPRWAAGLTALLLVVPLGFCCWYYTTEYHRLSPELAGAGLSIIWIDWITVIALSIIVITAGAYRLSHSDRPTTTVSRDLTDEIDLTALHESFPCLCVLAANALLSLSMYAVMFATFNPGMRISSAFTVWVHMSMLCSPNTLLVIAGAALSLRLCWLRWRRRSETVAWELAAVPPGQFCLAWIGLAFLLAVGVATLNASAFVFWLGPFNFLGV